MFILFMTIWVFVELYLENLFAALVFVVYLSVLAGTFAIAWKHKRLSFFTHFLVFTVLVVISLTNYFTGGIKATNVTSYFFMMVIAPCALGRKGLIWSGISLLVAFAFQCAHFAGHPFPEYAPPEKREMDAFFTWASAAVGVFFVLIGYEWVRVSTWRALKHSERELRSKETALLKSQKMETVGRLAGGIAHDYNNILNIIMGYAAVVKNDVASNAELTEDLEAIIDASKRGAKLTEQLLAFSKRQVLEAVPMNLNEVVAQTCKMMRRVFDERYILEVDLEPTLKNNLLDVGQTEQVILNLAVNAQQAMPEGGTLTITTANGCRVLEEEGTNGPEDVVVLSISDTGCGIPEEHIDTIFDPFFSTKEAGSGLGLSVVAGIVAQHKGTIAVESQAGKGTNFTVTLPAIDTPTSEETTAEGTEPSLKGEGEIILAVEDEPYIRRLLKKQLEGSGYAVVTAEDGERALAILNSGTPRVDLLFSDVVLPGISGVELSVTARQARPDLPVLLTSGHADALTADDLKDSAGNVLPFLRKPYEPDDLLKRLRAILTKVPPAAR